MHVSERCKKFNLMYETLKTKIYVFYERTVFLLGV